MPLPEELLFTVDEKVCSDINHAKQQYQEAVSFSKALILYVPTVSAVWPLPVSVVFQAQDLQVVCYAFTAFGKKAVKEKKLHPDTFVQLAMQLAYYKMHKK